MARSNRMSPIELSEDARRFLDRHTRGHLATADKDGAPHVVPLCYARIGEYVYFVCDEKPKRRGPLGLKRLANLRENPRAALVVDDYDRDWTKLAYLLVQVDGEIVTDTEEYGAALATLRARYEQYERMPLRQDTHPIVRLTPTNAHLWIAAPPQIRN